MGPEGPLLAIETDLTMKLHAVAPGGPPEGQCKREDGLLRGWQPGSGGDIYTAAMYVIRFI